MRAGRASSTARLIAAAVVAARRDPILRALVPAGAAEWSERFLRASGGWLPAIAGSAAGRAVLRMLERAVAPGIARHWLLRKRRIERWAREAMGDGFSQLVVLGAGFDALAFRLGTEGIRAIEVDHPATQAVVRSAAGPECDVALIPADLTGPDALEVLTASPAFDTNRATLFIAEGLLMYLTESQVRALLRDAATLPCPRARLVASYMDTPPGLPIGFRGQSPFVEGWLHQRGEPMRWSIVDKSAPAFLADCGWRCRQLVRAADLVAELDPGARPLEGENLLVADRAYGAPLGPAVS